MKQKLLSAFLAAAMFCTAAIPAVSASEERSMQNVQTVSDAPLAQASFDEEYVYNAIIALQDKYPDDMEWTNDNFYMWNGGGPYSGGYGCVAFAFILSDAAFGNLPARQVNTLDLSAIRVGDIIRYSGHSVIVLEVHEDYVIVAEGNINSSVMWGRDVSLDELSDGFEHYLTRYPEEEEETPTPETTLGDVDVNGVVDASDAGDLLVAAAAIGAGNGSGLTAEQTANADVDGNGVLDATDAAWILRYAAYTGTGGNITMEEFFAQNS